jgi:hypothetical protein
MITKKDHPTQRGGTQEVGLETEMREITEIEEITEITEIEDPQTTSPQATEEVITSQVKTEDITEMKEVIATEVALIIGVETEAQVAFTGQSEESLHELIEGPLRGKMIDPITRENP